MLPDFIYVGGSKCGSSWIYEILREHPQIFVPDAKDIMYFDRHPDRPLSWYGDFFHPGPGQRVVGELSHDYFLYPHIAADIRRQVPQVRIIACLRDPVARTFSRWLYARSTDLPRHVCFADFAASADIQRENRYLENLRPYFAAFPRDRVLVLLYDEMAYAPEQFVRRLYDFLGVAADFQPPSLHRRVLSAREARVGILAPLLWAGGKMLRDLGGANLVGRVKRSAWFEKAFYKPFSEKPVLSRDDAHAVRMRTLADYPALEQLTGVALPRSWYGEPVTAAGTGPEA